MLKLFILFVLLIFISCTSAMDNKFVCENYGNIEDVKLNEFTDTNKQKVRVYDKLGNVKSIPVEYINQNALKISDGYLFSKFSLEYTNICSKNITQLNHFYKFKFIINQNLLQEIKKIDDKKNKDIESKKSEIEKYLQDSNFSEEYRKSINIIKLSYVLNIIARKMELLIEKSNQTKNSDEIISENNKLSELFEKTLKEVDSAITDNICNASDFTTICSNIESHIKEIKISKEKIINAEKEIKLYLISIGNYENKKNEMLKVLTETNDNLKNKEKIIGVLIDELLLEVEKIIYADESIEIRKENLKKYASQFDKDIKEKVLRKTDSNNQYNIIRSLIPKAENILYYLELFYKEKDKYIKYCNAGENEICNENLFSNDMYLKDVQAKLLLEELIKIKNKKSTLLVHCYVDDIKAHKMVLGNVSNIRYSDFLDFKCNEKIELAKTDKCFSIKSDKYLLEYNDFIFNHNYNPYNNEISFCIDGNAEIYIDSFDYEKKNRKYEDGFYEYDKNKNETFYVKNQEYSIRRLRDPEDLNPLKGDENIDIKEKTGYYLIKILDNKTYSSKYLFSEDLKSIKFNIIDNRNEEKYYKRYNRGTVDRIELSNYFDVSKTNGIFIGGYFEGNIDFNFDKGQDFKKSKLPQTFIMFVDENLNYKWTYTSFSDIILNQIDDLYIYMILISKTSSKLVKLDKKTGKEINNTPISMYSSMMIVDDDKNIYLIGTFKNAVDFDPSDKKDYKTSDNATDYISKFDKNLKYIKTDTTSNAIYEMNKLIGEKKFEDYSIKTPLVYYMKDTTFGYKFRENHGIGHYSYIWGYLDYIFYDTLNVIRIEKGDVYAYYYTKTKNIKDIKYIEEFKFPDKFNINVFFEHNSGELYPENLSINDFDIVSTETKVINNIDCKIITYLSERNGIKYKGVLALYQGKEKIYELNIGFEEKEFENYTNMINEVIMSFKLLKKE